MMGLARRAAGGTDILLSIGGVVGRVQLIGGTAAFLEDVERRNEGFTLPCSPVVDRAFSIQVIVESTGQTRGTRDQRPMVTSNADRLDISRWDFSARLARKPGQTVFHGIAHCQETPFAFESLLRVLWSVFLPRSGGGLFHACGLRSEGRGILAPGPSGAGKTTLARKMSDPGAVLSDEVVAVFRQADGQWRIAGTPFFGELGRGPVSLQSWPLAGIAFLEKKMTLSVTPLAAADAVFRALECLMCFEADPATVEQNFSLVIALCAAVPAFLCATLVDTPLPAVLQEMQPHLARADASEAPNTRDLIAGLRANVRRHGSYAFRPRGTSMRPWLHSGDSLFIEAVGEEDLMPGDVVLYWRAGRLADSDSLICHRVVGRLPTGRGSRIVAKGDSLDHLESFDNGTEAEVLGRVRALSRGGENRPLPGRLVSIGILMASLVLMPWLRLMARK